MFLLAFMLLANAIAFEPAAVRPGEARIFNSGNVNSIKAGLAMPRPAASFVSCDRSTWVTVGPTSNKSKPDSFGGVWSWRPSGLYLQVGVGDVLKSADARPENAPKITRASCVPARTARAAAPFNSKRQEQGESADRSLVWFRQQSAAGERLLVLLWNGRGYDPVVDKFIPYF